jgi:hypothetical protein
MVVPNTQVVVLTRGDLLIATALAGLDGRSLIRESDRIIGSLTCSMVEAYPGKDEAEIMSFAVDAIQIAVAFIKTMPVAGHA